MTDTVHHSLTTEQAAEPSNRLASFNPATGEVLGYVSLMTPEELNATIEAAADAARIWGQTSHASRRAYLQRLRRVLLQKSDALAQLIASEQGKTPGEAYVTEIFPSLAYLKWLESDGLKLLRSRRVSPSHPVFGSKRMYYRYDPLGVIGIIAPWNYPFGIPFMQLVAALAAGNTVVVKPSPFTPLVGQKIATICREAELPAGVVNVVHVRDEHAPLIVQHPLVDKIVFTGSVATGRKVMATAAAGPKDVVLELGGKDAAIVAYDADLERAIPGITWMAMENAGQTCASVEIALVHRAVYDAFVNGVVDIVRGLRVGNPLDPNTDVGPLSNARQLQIVEEQVQDALAKGARALVGGHRLEGPGYFFAPTVLVDVTPDMRIVQEETFGPVLVVLPVASIEEAIAFVNSMPFGLTASVWTQSPVLAHEVAARLKVGAVNVNDHACQWGEPKATWGGVKSSGFGRVIGPYGLYELVNIKFVTEEYREKALEAWWYPYDKNVPALMSDFAQALYGPVIKRPLALLKLMFNRRARERVNFVEYVRHLRTWF